MSYEPRKKNKGFTHATAGFTIIEALIAIAILAVAASAALGIAQKALSSAYYSQDQTTAFFLAAESVELVRNLRDNVYLVNIDRIANEEPLVNWLEALKTAGCVGVGSYGNYCDIDPLGNFQLDGYGVLVDNSDGAVVNNNCGSSGCLLKQTSSGVYSSYSGTTPTKFRRSIRLNERVAGKELDMEVRVTWTTGSYGQNEFIVYPTIFTLNAE